LIPFKIIYAISINMDNGLICPEAYSNPQTSYYADADTAIIAPTLVSPITLEAADRTSAAFLTVGGAAEGVYQGAVSIQSGANGVQADTQVAITARSAAAGAIVEIGDNAQASNLLYIAGAQGVAQVYDEKYNQPVSLQPITLSATSPLAQPIVGNVGEIFRCSQAGVAASAVNAIGTNFQVPRTGWYCLQIEMKLQNAVAPAAPDINVPIVAAGGIDIGQTLSWAVIQGSVVEPYGLLETVAQEFAAADILVQGGNVVRQYVSQHLLAAGTTYTFTLKSSSALWNIGSGGVLKAELIAMC
jgi:membrane-associated protease RseP (regulator of RpoE activity)